MLALHNNHAIHSQQSKPKFPTEIYSRQNLTFLRFTRTTDDNVVIRRHSVYSLVNGFRQGFFGCVGRKNNNKKNYDFLFVGEKKVLHVFMSEKKKQREGEERVTFNKRWLFIQ